VLSAVIEPVFGLLADAGKRRAVVLWGGLAFAASLILAAGAQGFGILLVAYLVLYAGSGAFTALSEAALMDARPSARERNMARWALAGSIGVVAGPLLLVASISAGTGWRPILVALGLAGALLAWTTRRVPVRSEPATPVFLELVRAAGRSLRHPGVLRWLALLQVQDLMVDVLFGFLALYFVDVQGTSPATAGLAVAVWTGAGLVGDALVIPVLRRVPALVWLRWSAVAVAVVFPAFLLVPTLPAKLALLSGLAVLTGGWYAVPKARLYAALPAASGTAMALTSLSGLIGGLFPLAVGALASAVGLGGALWVCLLGPVGLIALLPSGRSPRPGGPETARSAAPARR
jgi:FSR family fosmidomycin resistance protein-like MFS transporter